MRVVADTNVLVSALIFPGGPPETVYRLALEGQVAQHQQGAIGDAATKMLGDDAPQRGGVVLVDALL